MFHKEQSTIKRYITSTDSKKLRNMEKSGKSEASLLKRWEGNTHISFSSFLGSAAKSEP